MDFLRIKDQMNVKEIKGMKEKLRYYEGPTSTGFRGFNSAEARGIMGVTQNTNM